MTWLPCFYPYNQVSKTLMVFNTYLEPGILFPPKHYLYKIEESSHFVILVMLKTLRQRSKERSPEGKIFLKMNFFFQYTHFGIRNVVSNLNVFPKNAVLGSCIDGFQCGFIVNMHSEIESVYITDSLLFLFKGAIDK